MEHILVLTVHWSSQQTFVSDWDWFVSYTDTVAGTLNHTIIQMCSIFVAILRIH